MIIIVAVGLCVILFILLSMQFAYVRSRIEDVKASTFEKERTLEKKTQTVISNENRLRVYSILINMAACDIIQSLGASEQHALREHANLNRIAIPYVCNGYMNTVSATIDRISFLVVKNNNGGLQLLRDVNMENLNYIILKNKVFYIKHDPDLINKLKGYFTTTGGSVDFLEDSTIFTIYSLVDHKIETGQEIDTDKCEFSILTFMGGFTSMYSEGSPLINMRMDIIGDNTVQGMDIFPTHILGYRA